MTPLIAVHAFGAALALTLGGYNLWRTPKGNRQHRLVGRVWVVAMYWTVVSSFFIKELDPGHFSWIHLLSVFTFVTLSLGLWAAMTGRVERHRGFMRGSYFGLAGAFVGAVAVPQRDIPQLAVNHPWQLVAGVAAVLAATGTVLVTCRPSSAEDRSLALPRERTTTRT